MQETVVEIGNNQSRQGLRSETSPTLHSTIHRVFTLGTRGKPIHSTHHTQQLFNIIHADNQIIIITQKILTTHPNVHAKHSRPRPLQRRILRLLHRFRRFPFYHSHGLLPDAQHPNFAQYARYEFHRQHLSPRGFLPQCEDVGCRKCRGLEFGGRGRHRKWMGWSAAISSELPTAAAWQRFEFQVGAGAAGVAASIGCGPVPLPAKKDVSSDSSVCHARETNVVRLATCSSSCSCSCSCSCSARPTDIPSQKRHESGKCRR
mmetsp:Transcript_30576/g.58428  ORF Transcript_30576/g.58428 Transcript_30576/m.58428 type:complete len:261 (-) Transcript_30576:505-1287(-)